MPRQLQGQNAPASKVTGVVPIEKGGTGASTADEAVGNLGGLYRTIIGKPEGLVEADSQGHLPIAILKGAGITVGYTIEGPSVLVYEQLAIFRLTNFNSFADITVSVDVGSVELVNDEIRVMPPASGSELTLTVNERKLVLPIQTFAPLKPRILYPKKDASVQLKIMAYAAPFRGMTDLYGDWVDVTVENGVSVFLPTTAVGIECEGRKGISGTAVVDFGDSLYQFGYSMTRRRLDRTIENVVTFYMTGTGGLRYRFIYPTAKHLSTDWQLATDEGFTNIIKESLGDTVNLITWPLELSAGQYYIRSRFNGETL